MTSQTQTEDTKTYFSGCLAGANEESRTIKHRSQAWPAFLQGRGRLARWNRQKRCRSSGSTTWRGQSSNEQRYQKGWGRDPLDPILATHLLDGNNHQSRLPRRRSTKKIDKNIFKIVKKNTKRLTNAQSVQFSASRTMMAL